MTDQVVISVQQVESTKTVSEEVLRGWLKRAKYYFVRGVIVFKVSSQGKLVRRTVFVGTKPEVERSFFLCNIKL